VCRQLRAMSDCYVLMLTARAEEVDMLVGLAVGADGYMVKPFSPRELTARVQTMLRRARPEPADVEPDVSNVERVGDLEVDLDAREVRIEATNIPVTRTEFDLLAMLASKPGRVFQRETLLREVWQTDWDGNVRLVEVHMSNLRRKLVAAGVASPDIRTVRGVGYRLVL
jgi:DNA-binding response OmpR family regulator